MARVSLASVPIIMTPTFQAPFWFQPERPIIVEMTVGKRTKLAGAALAFAGLLTAASIRSQSNQEKPAYVLKETVRLVIVPVTVKDRHGNLVDDLAQGDFRILEDGRERPIRFFSTETMPLSTVILLDTGISERSLGAVRATLRSLAYAFGPDDEEALYFFDDSVRLAQDFTSRAELLVKVAEKAVPEGKGPSLLGGPLARPPHVPGVPVDRPGNTPVYAPRVRKRIHDALFSAAQRLKNRPAGRRRAVVIVSDGVNGSDNRMSYDETLEALTASDVTVYAVSFGGGWALKRTDLLARVARETGGDIIYVQRAAGLDAAYPRLTNAARNAYVLGFPPASADGKFHEIQVRVTRPALRLIARHRFLAPLVE